MELEIMLTGVGGQGVQLGAQILARAATLEGREVMSLGTYGGTMRGGNTDSTLVIADQRIQSPPIVAQVGAAIAMHHAFFDPIQKKLRPDALVVVNSTVFDAEVDCASLFEVPATRIATDLGNPLGASLVLVAAFARVSGCVDLDALVAAMKESVPAYRSQHLESNERSLREGFAALPCLDGSPWSQTGADN